MKHYTKFNPDQNPYVKFVYDDETNILSIQQMGKPALDIFVGGGSGGGQPTQITKIANDLLNITGSGTYHVILDSTQLKNLITAETTRATNQENFIQTQATNNFGQVATALQFQAGQIEYLTNNKQNTLIQPEAVAVSLSDETLDVKVDGSTILKDPLTGILTAPGGGGGGHDDTKVDKDANNTSFVNTSNYAFQFIGYNPQTTSATTSNIDFWGTRSGGACNLYLCAESRTGSTAGTGAKQLYLIGSYTTAPGTVWMDGSRTTAGGSGTVRINGNNGGSTGGGSVFIYGDYGNTAQIGNGVVKICGTQYAPALGQVSILAQDATSTADSSKNSFVKIASTDADAGAKALIARHSKCYYDEYSLSTEPPPESEIATIGDVANNQIIATTINSASDLYARLNLSFKQSVQYNCNYALNGGINQTDNLAGLITIIGFTGSVYTLRGNFSLKGDSSYALMTVSPTTIFLSGWSGTTTPTSDIVATVSGYAMGAGV